MTRWWGRTSRAEVERWLTGEHDAVVRLVITCEATVAGLLQYEEVTAGPTIALPASTSHWAPHGTDGGSDGTP